MVWKFGEFIRDFLSHPVLNLLNRSISMDLLKRKYLHIFHAKFLCEVNESSAGSLLVSIIHLIDSYDQKKMGNLRPIYLKSIRAL